MANVRLLCKTLHAAGLESCFVSIVGRELDRKLGSDLKALTDEFGPRFCYYGTFGTMNEIVCADYAVSFDPAGFRTNASAMVNVLRSGILLFSRREGEKEDGQFINRIVSTIKICEGNPSYYRHRLAEWQPEYAQLRSSHVANLLGRFFRSLFEGSD